MLAEFSYLQKTNGSSLSLLLAHSSQAVSYVSQFMPHMTLSLIMRTGCAIGTSVAISYDTSVDGMDSLYVHVGIMLTQARFDFEGNIYLTWRLLGSRNPLAYCLRSVRYNHRDNAEHISGMSHPSYIEHGGHFNEMVALEYAPNWVYANGQYRE